MYKENKDKYVTDNMKIIQEKHQIPEHLEFNIKTMLGLQYDFDLLPPDHVKNKREILDMIIRIQNNLPHGLFGEK